MTENELTNIIVDELKEFALANKHKDDKTSDELTYLSKKVKKILAELPSEDAKIVESYIEKAAASADEDCRYLYIQGVKDCVKALKRLEII